MPNREITSLVELVTITDTSSVLHIVDLSEALEDDQNKKITFANLLVDIGNGITVPEPAYFKTSFAGAVATPTGTDSIAVGQASLSAGTNSIVMGMGPASAAGTNDIAIGNLATITATGGNNILLGTNTDLTAGAINSISIGASNVNPTIRSVAIGDQVNIDSNGSVGIGNLAQVSVAANAIAIGTQAHADDSEDSIAIGNQASTQGTGGLFGQIAIGRQASTTNSGCIAIGNLSSATGIQATAVGNGSDADGFRSVALGAADVDTAAAYGISIGDLSVIHATATDGAICIGSGPDAFADFATVIGHDAQGNHTSGVSLGDGCELQGATSVVGGVVIGLNSTANAADTLAVGTTAVASASGAFQLGTGTNSTADTLQFQANTIANDQGIQAPTYSGVPVTVVPDGSLAVDTTGNAFYFRSGGVWLTPSGGGGEPYVEINSAGTLPSATGTDAIAIGEGAIADNTDATAVGTLADAGGTQATALGWDSDAGGNSSVAIGHQASSPFADNISIGRNAASQTGGMAIGVLAFARGTNQITIGNTSTTADSTSDSVCVGNGAGTATSGSSESVCIGHNAQSNASRGIALGALAICNANTNVQIGAGTNGTASTIQFLTEIIANANGIQAPTSAGAPASTPADGSIAVDTTNDELYFRSSGAWQMVSGGGGGGAFTSNVETLAATKTINSGDPIVQALNPNGTARIVVLPDPPSNNDHFVIINDSDGLSASGNTLNIRETAAGPDIQVLDDTTGLLNINAIYNSAASTWVLWS